MAVKRVKPCPGVEDRSCGESIPATRTRCEACQKQHRRLARRAHNRSAYLKRQAERQELSRDRDRQAREKADRRIARRVATWEIQEEEKAEKRSGFYRFRRPEELPDEVRPSELPSSVFRGVRAARRERIMAMVPAIKEERLRRAEARERKRLKDRADAEPPRDARPRWGETVAPARHLPVPARPAAAGATGRETVTERLDRMDRMSREAKREAKRIKADAGKRRGRPRKTAAEKLGRRIKQAQTLYYLIEHEGRGYDVAWYALHPGSSATRENAAIAARREVDWFRERYLSETKAVRLKTGLYDFDFFIRPIKEGLAATRIIRGKLTDLPDWRARREALKMLMIGLQLAMLDGFRSGPRALGGVLQDAPISTAADVPPRGEDDDDAYALRRFKAEGIFVRHRIEGKPLAECWRAVNPDSKANPETARKEAARLLDWFEKRFTSPLLQRLVAEGLDTITVADGINDLLNATTMFGGPDQMIRRHGIELLMVLHGFRRKPEDVPATCFNVLSMMPDAERKSFFEELKLSPEELESRESAREKPELSLEEQRAQNVQTLIRDGSRGVPPEQSWAAVYSDDAGVSRARARELIGAEIEWCRRNHPIPMKRLLFLRGMDADFLVEKLLSQATATLGSNIRVMEDGKIVRRYYEPTPFPDYRTRLKATLQVMAISQAGARGLERWHALLEKQKAARGSAA